MTSHSVSSTSALSPVVASPAECRKAPWLTHNQLFVLDITMLTAVWGIAWSLRFEGLDWLASDWREAASYHLMLAVPMWLGIMAAFRLYRCVWSMASVEELKAMMAAVLVAAIANVTLGVFLMPVFGLSPTRLPLSVISSHTMWSIVAICCRVFWRACGLCTAASVVATPYRRRR